MVGNNVMLITGAGQGLGEGISLGAAQSGYDLVLVDINKEKLSSVSEKCRQFDVNVYERCLDITNNFEVRETIKEVIEQIEKIDVLVNNAGIMQTKSILDITEDDWEKVMSVNLKAVFFLSQIIGRSMMERKKGSIINIASVAAKASRPMAIHYGVSKSGIISLTRSMAEFFGRYGIRVNAVSPGAMETELLVNIGKERSKLLGVTEEEALNEYIGPIPMNRLGKPNDVAQMVLFLASENASYITGQSINVCGGWQMV